MLNVFQERMILIDDVFAKLTAPKNVVRSMSKKSYFRGPFDRQHNKWVETLLEFEQQQLYHIY